MINSLMENRQDDDVENTKDFNKNRPVSRRGQRILDQETAVNEMKQERILSRAASTVSTHESGNWRPSSGIARIQGTASRLISTMSHQRGLSIAVTPPHLNAQLNITDRLITQQGLSSRARSTGTGLRGPGKRQVLDKRYYEGLLQLKIQELINEIASLRKKTEISNKERNDIIVYDRQNKERAKELTELQGTLADYNLVMDKIHTGTEVKDIESEYEIIKRNNDSEQIKLELLFKERTQKQQQIHQLEEEIKKERHASEKLMENMPPDLQEKYSELSNENVKLQKTIDKIQWELDAIIKEKSFLEQQIATAPLKQEAVKLELKLVELEEKKNHLLAEENDNNSNNLQQKYLNQVKEDNAEILTIERSMNQLNDELKNYQILLEQTEQDLEECQSERHKKYTELRKREETIESFLSVYNETKQKELNNAVNLKSEIIRAMTVISEHLITLPATETEYNLINAEPSQLDSDEIPEEKTLYMQYKHKQLYLQKLSILEKKLRVETENLENRISIIQSEIEIYENLDGLKNETEKKRLQLLEKKKYYLEDQNSLKDELKIINEKYEIIQKELQDNETYKQLQALERKLASIEQDNFMLKEFIANKKCEINYELYKEKVLELVRQYNNNLKDKYRSNLKLI